METRTQNNYRAKIHKQYIWLMTILLMIAGLPLLKNAIVAFLVKLYELFIQYAMGR